MEDVSLRDYLDCRIQNVEGKLDTLERFLTQHFELNERAIKKAEESMTNRLEGMNEFREQIKEERSSYATQKDLDIRLKPLEEAKAFASGKMWMIMAIFAAIPTIIAILAFVFAVDFKP